MITREELVKKINSYKWNEYFDSFVSEEIKYKEEKFERKFNENLEYEEEISIVDSYTLTSFVIFEKYDLKNTKLSIKYWDDKAKEKHFKIVTKKSEKGNLKHIKLNVERHQFPLQEYEKLQKELELKKHNVLYDGNDLNQVIQYYQKFKLI